ncbi:GcrA family cell cycle regulator [Alphaproteobacteria bacterium]|jgi:GcrA cell cycle regulator|nr:global cell cycle regulator GcrA-like protein [Alphaproteobacteria bacterium]MBT5799249.1 global cell cycle regulator GcrA-like protein [Alphaproteobacteria bacterium]MDC0394473.1 GcrA family cell cycle regulator [Alphaproteobacteria bacterium]MDC3311650.1 GcrA family cell cycle regulator [Alphaproteobacteria bacterium]
MTEETGWTEERLKMLKALWDEGLSISQIGQRLNVTRNAVAGKAHRLSLPKRQSPISSTAAPVRAKVKKTEEIADELPLRLALRKISWSRSKCVWPTGDPKTTDFSFCSKPIDPGKPYCFEHCVLAYTNTRESN